MISIVIPIYNSLEQLRLTLNGFLEQTLSPDSFVLFIVDDGSSVSHEPIINEYKHRLQIKYIYKDHGGRSCARNGAKEMIQNNGLIIFNDADRIPGPQFIQAHVEFHDKYKDCICIGNAKEIYFTNLKDSEDKIMEVVRTNSKMAKRIQVHKILYRLYNQDGSTDSHIPWITTFSGNMSISANLLNKHGWFDEKFTDWGFEHFELGFRLYNNGVKFRYEERSINYHLAHSRKSGELFESMKKSHIYFLEKHTQPIIANLMRLMDGDISIQDFELIATNGKKSGFTERQNEPMYLNIIN